MVKVPLVCLQVGGPKQDLHSGVYGGAVIEPMTDLIGILGECIFSVASTIELCLFYFYYCKCLFN